MRTGKRLLLAGRIGFIAVVLLFVGYYVYKNWTKLQQADWHLSPFALAVAGSVYAVYLIANTLVWRFILARLGHTVPVARGTAAYLVSALARYIPGKIWPVASRVVLFERLSVPASVVGTGMVLEFIASIAAAVLVVLVSLSAKRVSLGVSVPPELILLSIPTAMVLLYPRIFRWPVNIVLARLRKPLIPESIRYVDTLLLVFFYAVIWGVLGVGIWFVARSVAGVQIHAFLPITGMFALAWLIGYFTFLAPAGLGVREGVFAELLAVDMPFEKALVIAVLLRLVTTVVEVAVAAVAYRLGYRADSDRTNA